VKEYDSQLTPEDMVVFEEECVVVRVDETCLCIYT
jgi:hypothetical protein